MQYKSFFRSHELQSTKGSQGTILIIGGSWLYSGAPYFAALSALRTGTNLVYIMSEKEAVLSLKILLPEAICLEIEKLEWILDRIDVCVVGTGLGRPVEHTCTKIQSILSYFSLDTPIIFDCDGIHFFIDRFKNFKNNKNIILTPNHNEYKKLETTGITNSKTFSNFYVVRKGVKDVISQDINFIEVDTINSLNRCGGQGDILDGIIASLLVQNRDKNVLEVLAFSCKLLRKASYFAYKNNEVGLITTDIINQLQNAINEFKK